MSMQRTPDALLPHYGAPIYPPDIGKLARALGAADLSDARLQGAASSCGDYVGFHTDIVANDGYHWRAIAWFCPEGGYVGVAIPHANDASKRGGTRLDRSPAVYVVDKAMMPVARTLLLELATAIQAVS